MSSVVVVFSAYLSASRRYGSVSLEHSAYFLGAYVGPYVVSAIIILGYYLISRRKDQNSTKLMAVFFGASFFAFLSLIVPTPAARSGPDPAWAQHLSESSRIPKAVSSRTATVWDAAIISLLADLKSFNDDYVSAVSSLDLSAQPLYTPTSFRDVPTIQQMLAQLRDRLAVAEKFSSLDPLVAKMPAYVAAVNASDEDKRRFLEGFSSGAQQGFASRNTASAHEREWLRSSIALYEFMLANQGSYSISPDGQTGTFRSHGIGAEFDRRLQKVQQLKQQFLQANRAYLASLNAARAQLGMTE